MKKIEKRAIMCLLLAFLLLVGVGVFSYRYVAYGDDWASYEGNRDVYADGDLSKGRLFDTNGTLLMQRGSFRRASDFCVRGLRSIQRGAASISPRVYAPGGGGHPLCGGVPGQCRGLLRCAGRPGYGPRGWPVLVSSCIGHGGPGGGPNPDGRGHHRMEQPSGKRGSRGHEQLFRGP